MKLLAFLLFLSIFLFGHICSAQKKFNLLLCDNQPGNISIAQLQSIVENDNCKFVNFTGENGNVIEIKEYTFALANADDSGAYFENVKGNTASEEIKKRLLNAGAGDMIVIANVKCIYNGQRENTDGANFKITH